MTSDAKIGLLLSLIFIFIIAFIINGFPDFLRGKDGNKLTRDYLNKLRSYDSDITNGAREVVEAISTFEPVKKVELTGSRHNEDSSARFAGPLPQINPALGDSIATRPADLSLPVTDQQRETQTARSAESDRPQIYVVKDEDSLALIARKFYGPEEGSKRENLEKIFIANRDILSSPDLLQVGQRLLIPPLQPAQELPLQASVDSKHLLFEKVEGPGAKSLPLASTIQAQTGRYREYIVREGDSLWKIAEEQLANPSRYIEIVRLNEDIIEDENELVVGMRIKLPNR
jgi:nucleoid-associated protein YgaU